MKKIKKDSKRLGDDFVGQVENISRALTVDIFSGNCDPMQFIMEDLEELVEKEGEKNQLSGDFFAKLTKYIIASVKWELESLSIPDDCRYRISTTTEDNDDDIMQNAFRGWMKHAIENNVKIPVDEEGNVDIWQLRPKGDFRKAVLPEIQDHEEPLSLPRGSIPLSDFPKFIH
jgi:hypothetical protein